MILLVSTGGGGGPSSPLQLLIFWLDGIVWALGLALTLSDSQLSAED